MKNTHTHTHGNASNPFEYYYFYYDDDRKKSTDLLAIDIMIITDAQYL